MTDFKAMMRILGGVFVVMFAVFYEFLFPIYPDGVPTLMPVVTLKS